MPVPYLYTSILVPYQCVETLAVTASNAPTRLRGLGPKAPRRVLSYGTTLTKTKREQLAVRRAPSREARALAEGVSGQRIK